MDWDSYLNLLLPEDSPQRQILAERNTIRDALQTGADEPLLVDLYRLAVDERKFTPALEKAVGPWKLATHRRHAQLFVHMNQTVKEMVRELFRDLDFTQWREKFGQEYLKEKRRQEKLAGRYARPYLDYYARMENHLFEAFWEINRWPLITSFLLGESSRPAPADIAPYVQHLSSYHRELSSGAHAGEAWTTDYKVLTGDLKRLHPAIAVEYLRTLRSFEDLDRPLLGTYPNVRSEGGQQFEKHLATAFYPVYGFGCMRPHAYRQAAVPGSVFKIVTAYAGLTQEWERLGADVSTVPLFEIMDGVGRLPDGKGWMVGTTLSGQPIPQVYRGGRLIRTLTKNVGRVDLQRALEVSSNPYFSLLAGDLLTDPEQLNEAAHLLGYGQQTGIALPGELAGRLPTDLRTNKSGLYAAAIGQHTLVVTPLQTAVMLSTVANGGQVLVPKLVRLTAGKLPVRRAGQLMQKERFLYQRSLNLIGVHFPLFTGVEGVEGVHQVYPVQTTEVRDVPMPPAVRRPILQGMQRMVQNARTAGWPALVKIYSSQPDALRALQEMKGTFVAKSSTAEALEAVDVDTERGAHIYNHVWAGAIAFSPSEADNQKSMMVFTDPYGDPELVVVVYLRFGGYGKHALPVAAQIVEKWREIRARQ